MEDETSSSEPLLAAVEAQNAAANGNGFCMDEGRIAEARKSYFVVSMSQRLRFLGLRHAFQCGMLQTACATTKHTHL